MEKEGYPNYEDIMHALCTNLQAISTALCACRRAVPTIRVASVRMFRCRNSFRFSRTSLEWRVNSLTYPSAAASALTSWRPLTLYPSTTSIMLILSWREGGRDKEQRSLKVYCAAVIMQGGLAVHICSFSSTLCITFTITHNHTWSSPIATVFFCWPLGSSTKVAGNCIRAPRRLLFWEERVTLLSQPVQGFKLVSFWSQAHFFNL